MKGFVFSFNRRFRIPNVSTPKISFKEFLSRYGLKILFCCLFAVGIFIGAVYTKNADKSTVSRLDFLFLTNINSRADMGAFEVFVSCFCSDFLFVFLLFLCGLSTWGLFAIPFLAVFKGFSVGMSSALLFSLYRLSGLGFYILIVLPGTLLFLFAYIAFSKDSFLLSLKYARLSAFGSSREPYLSAGLRSYLLRSAYTLLVSAGAALLDMLLWVLFAHLFDF